MRILFPIGFKILGLLGFICLLLQSVFMRVFFFGTIVVGAVIVYFVSKHEHKKRERLIQEELAKAIEEQEARIKEHIAQYGSVEEYQKTECYKTDQWILESREYFIRRKYDPFVR